MVDNQYIDLGPSYQRRDRWSLERKSLLIESLLLGIPIPPIFMNEDEFGSYSIIDGKQRVSAVVEYLDGRFALQGLQVFGEANGLTFDHLEPPLKRVLSTRASLRATILLHVSDPDLKYLLFDRLNTGGVRLNPQEVRNNAFRGDLNDLVVELGESRQFHAALGVKRKESSSLWREMRDAELVLRFLAFREAWPHFRGSTAGVMNSFMRQNLELSDQEGRNLENEFTSTLAVAQSCFRDGLFRRWLPNGTAKRQILVALFDAQMLAIYERKERIQPIHHDGIYEQMLKLSKEEEFQRAIGSATNTPSYLKTRVLMVIAAIDSVIGN